ncbi:DUF3459 domain-containing protein [Pontibacter silvestris]|uniref:DUF3459 domain-containing protein n=1 Tax=Pontibacter silvestris TaxID=2305183 RepID=A0ABW4X1X6_9BACT|nr:DUF3459 domain-containing protein [Pontibacter silvestris]MCC9136084.1 DUF3459 domain-containing protein [Pontibacter silvestris]
MLQNFAKSGVRVDPLGQNGFVLHRQSSDGQQHIFCLFNLSEQTQTHTLPNLALKWGKVLDSKESNWLENDKEQEMLLPKQAQAGEELKLPPLSVAIYKEAQ